MADLRKFQRFLTRKQRPSPQPVQQSALFVFGFDPSNPRLAILDCTARGEVVLDALLRSGMMMIAAERTGRFCYGIELDPRYAWQAFTGQPAVQESTGRTFNEIEEESNAPAE